MEKCLLNSPNLSYVFMDTRRGRFQAPFHDSEARQNPPLKKYFDFIQIKTSGTKCGERLEEWLLIQKNEIQYTSFSYLHGSDAEEHKPVTKRAMMRFSLFVHTKIEVLDI